MAKQPIPSPSLESVFASLTTTDIAAFVTEQRQEDLTLDFKLAPKNLGDKDERKVLAKAISGFANSAGGLIVWGIDARKDADGIDCAQATVPIADPGLLMSRLIEYGAGATSAPAPGVLHRLVEGPGGPFALTYVPESDSGPHMAKLGEDRYYQRSGASFRVMEHFAIANMFGRRRRPQLKLYLTCESDYNSVLIELENVGRGAAKAPYLALVLPANFRPSQWGFDGNGRFGLKWGGWAYNKCYFGGDSTTVIHPGQRVPVSKIDVVQMNNSTGEWVVSGDQVVRYEIAAEEVPLTEDQITLHYPVRRER
jgi:hypothetical protein